MHMYVNAVSWMHVHTHIAVFILHLQSNVLGNSLAHTLVEVYPCQHAYADKQTSLCTSTFRNIESANRFRYILD